MERTAAWKPRLEVVIDLGAFGGAKTVCGVDMSYVCFEAEAYLREVLAVGLPFSLEVNAPAPEQDAIRKRLNDLAASMGKVGYSCLEEMHAEWPGER